ncbi:MAG: MarR family transcriptional regulator [Asgard group archaeon]|nr:MarR family transcriptional regulator [Asgard group archaeon]
MDYQVLSTILGDSIQVKIVEFFIINNTGMYQLTEIARILGISHSRVHDLIDSLVKMRIILETRSKRNRLFELNKDHPITKQLSELYKITRAYLVASQY